MISSGTMSWDNDNDDDDGNDGAGCFLSILIKHRFFASERGKTVGGRGWVGERGWDK